MERWEAKLVALFGCFILPLICTLLPKKLKNIFDSNSSSTSSEEQASCSSSQQVSSSSEQQATTTRAAAAATTAGRRYEEVLGWLMCFGGGIFFGTYLLHMGPEVHKLLKSSLLDPAGIDYPVADLFVGLGFLLVLFAEKFVLRWNKKRLRKTSNNSNNNSNRNDGVALENSHHHVPNHHHQNHRHSSNDKENDDVDDDVNTNDDGVDMKKLRTLQLVDEDLETYDNPAVDTSEQSGPKLVPLTHESIELSDTSNDIHPAVNDANGDLDKVKIDTAVNNNSESIGITIDDDDDADDTVDYNENNNIVVNEKNNKKKYDSEAVTSSSTDDVIVNYINAMGVDMKQAATAATGTGGVIPAAPETRGVDKLHKNVKSMNISGKSNTSANINDLNYHHHDHQQHHHHHYPDQQHRQHHHHHSTRSIILILALSLHRIFEGMSVGLQHSLQNVWSLFLAVMCHETVIGFSLGLQFVKSGLSTRRLLITSLICSSIMPLGVALGTIMTETGHQGANIQIANGILQAIAMGTFIYVTFFEILQEELDPDDTSLVKITFVALGFFLMALLDLIPEEDSVINSVVVDTTESVLTTTTKIIMHSDP